jgi:hypothetical protein
VSCASATDATQLRSGDFRVLVLAPAGVASALINEFHTGALAAWWAAVGIPLRGLAGSRWLA